MSESKSIEQARLVLCYLARIGVSVRVESGQLQLRPADRLRGNDLANVQSCKAELIGLIESGATVVDNFRWPPRFDTPEHRARRLQ